MTHTDDRGMSLVELLVSMAIGALISAMVFPMLLIFQSKSLAEISRNDLQDRAERLCRFLAAEIRDAAFQVGATPRHPDGTVLTLVHDSQSGNPLETLGSALLPDSGGPMDNDALTLVKGTSFFPAITLQQPGNSAATSLVLSRRPNRPPGSSREILPAPEAISHLVAANHRVCYPVRAAGQTVHLDQGLSEAIPAGTEIFGIRAHHLTLDPVGTTNRLVRDDFTSREILDDAIDGLQFEYLLADGHLDDNPDDLTTIRGIRVSLLVRDLRSDPEFFDQQTYRIGDRSYGPFRDHFRRQVVSQTLEVKNHGLP